jgi:glucose-6-phosphate dehydrogenase assembly protein OpcA
VNTTGTVTGDTRGGQSPVSVPFLDRGEAMPFSRIASAIARGSCTDAGGMRALVATVVAVGPVDRLHSAAETLQTLGDAGTVRGIVLSDAMRGAPSARVAGNTVILDGLKPPYLNNAVAALRLSSLPTLVWWRGGSPETLDGLADLADRIVLDEPAPEATWAHAISLFEDSAFSDMRWARLTQWRTLMAQFFDIPEVRAAATTFTHLHVTARDRLAATLFGAWLTSSLRFARGLTVDVSDGDLDVPIQEVRLGDDEQRLELRLAEHLSCVETEASVRGHRRASRIVSLRRLDDVGLLTEELGIRARDVAFERAIRTLVAAPS